MKPARGRRRGGRLPLFMILTSLAIVCVLAVALGRLWPHSHVSRKPPAPANTPDDRAPSAPRSRSDFPRIAEETSAPTAPAPAQGSRTTADILGEILRSSTRRPAETICTADGCVGPEYAAAKTRRLVEDHPGRFTDEQIAILNAYTIDGLSQAVRDSEARFLTATDETRDRYGEFYRGVLNLVALAAPDPPPVPEREQRAHEQYAAALLRAAPALAKMSPEEADRERIRMKEETFAELRAHR
jgi:hypothetical protein